MGTSARIVPEQRDDSVHLVDEEKAFLLKLARQAIEHVVCCQQPPALEMEQLSPTLRAPGVSFVTLTRGGMLRGCIGALEPYQSLAEDVREHAAAAAVDDYRFPPVGSQELADLHIEVSRLTPAKPLVYATPEELPGRLRPGVDGVILRDGMRRATFLPQVWEKLPAPADFLAHLCDKMGAAPDLWRRKKLEVMVYQVEEFAEPEQTVSL